MWATDTASQELGMSLTGIAPGSATITMTVRHNMINGHGTGHGGYIFTLADSAFAFACNTHNQRTVAQHCSITFIAPVTEGDVLTATATMVSKLNRSGIYDVRVSNQRDECVAEFRGHSRTIRGSVLSPEATPTVSPEL